MNVPLTGIASYMGKTYDLSVASQRSSLIVIIQAAIVALNDKNISSDQMTSSFNAYFKNHVLIRSAGQTIVATSNPYQATNSPQTIVNDTNEITVQQPEDNTVMYLAIAAFVIFLIWK